MKRHTIAQLAVAVAFALACQRAAHAHHSSAMYDTKRLVTLRGVVKEFRWTNPHVSMIIETDTSDNGGAR